MSVPLAPWTPLISFVIPTYNRATAVAAAVRSVLREWSEPKGSVEVIVVNDGSTDESSAVLNELSLLPNVTVVEFERNRGLAEARNTGVKLARGTWIALLDSDNELLQGVGPRLVEALSVLPSTVGVFWGGSLDSDGMPTVSHGSYGTLAGRDVVTRGLSGEHFSVIRTTLMRAVPYATSCGTHACEAAFWASVAQQTQFHVTNQPFQHYNTIGDDRICATENKIARASDFARCFELTAERLGGFAPLQAARAASRAALYACVADQWGQSIGMAFRALRLGPITKDVVLTTLLCIAGPSTARLAVRCRAEV